MPYSLWAQFFLSSFLPANKTLPASTHLLPLITNRLLTTFNNKKGDDKKGSENFLTHTLEHIDEKLKEESYKEKSHPAPTRPT